MILYKRGLSLFCQKSFLPHKNSSGPYVKVTILGIDEVCIVAADWFESQSTCFSKNKNVKFSLSSPFSQSSLSLSLSQSSLSLNPLSLSQSSLSQSSLSLNHLSLSILSLSILSLSQSSLSLSQSSLSLSQSSLSLTILSLSLNPLSPSLSVSKTLSQVTIQTA